jgi:hypothetical protein
LAPQTRVADPSDDLTIRKTLIAHAVVPAAGGHSPARIETPKWPGAAPAVSEPVIHVSIGRIEVRALAQERPAKPERKSPVMGLDEYLRSRATAGAR